MMSVACIGKPGQSPGGRIAASLLRFEGLLALTLAFGFLLRLQHLLLNRSLWLDEAFLSLAVLDRGLLEVATLPLPYNQTPPPLFLILVKAATLAFGQSETALRIVPFLSGCAALVLFPLAMGRRPRGCVLLATFLFAVSYGGIYYASEFKPYATEALLAVLCLLAGTAGATAGTRARLQLSLALIVLAPWLGFASIFLLTGLGGAMGYARWTGRREVGPGWGVWGVGMVSYGVLYLAYARPASVTQMQMEYWNAFAAPWITSWSALAWYGQRADLVLGHFFFLEHLFPVSCLLALALVGVVAAHKSDAPYGLLLTLPIVAAIALSLVGRFPLHERLLVFALPLCCILVAEGGMAAGRLLGTIAPAAAWIPILAVLLILARPVAKESLQASVFERQEFKQLSERIIEQLGEGEAVFVFQAAVPIYQYYSRRDPRVAQFLPVSITRGDPDSVAQAVRSVKGAGRGWVVFAHDRRSEERQFEDAFEQAGEIRNRLTVRGAWAFAFAVKNDAGLDDGARTVEVNSSRGGP